MKPRKKYPFTILFSFMSSVLHLYGYTKETFAVIFGFWLSGGEKPVPASLSTIQKITGATRPAVVQAIENLISRNLLSALKSPGRRTFYSVILDPQLLLEIKEDIQNKVDKPFNQPCLADFTSAGKVAKPRNQGKPKVNPLRMKSATEMSTGDLEEAK